MSLNIGLFIKNYLVRSLKIAAARAVTVIFQKIQFNFHINQFLYHTQKKFGGLNRQSQDYRQFHLFEKI